MDMSLFPLPRLDGVNGLVTDYYKHYIAPQTLEHAGKSSRGRRRRKEVQKRSACKPTTLFGPPSPTPASLPLPQYLLLVLVANYLFTSLRRLYWLIFLVIYLFFVTLRVGATLISFSRACKPFKAVTACLVGNKCKESSTGSDGRHVFATGHLKQTFLKVPISCPLTFTTTHWPLMHGSCEVLTGLEGACSDVTEVCLALLPPPSSDILYLLRGKKEKKKKKATSVRFSLVFARFHYCTRLAYKASKRSGTNNRMRFLFVRLFPHFRVYSNARNGPLLLYWPSTSQRRGLTHITHPDTQHSG